MLDFKRIEQDTLSFWKENKIFEKSLENRKKAKKFVFWEGPPTANGLPHIGHFLTRVYKDVYGRYKTMRGFFVLRKAGWDTHGLPVEIEVEKELGFKNKKDIEKYGIAEFNKKAKESVWKYKAEWEEMTRRTGFWLDTDNPYITYENKYIESLWAVIKKIWDKKLLYLAHRVVPFCTRCGTPLSSHEVAQGYKTVTDKAVTVKFLISNSEFLNKLKIQNPNIKTYILAWTTTPWTLPGNVALAVGKDIEYAVVEREGESLIVAKDLVEKVFGPGLKVSEFKSLKGKDLVGLEYEPLFDVKELKSDKSYRIYDADFVSTEEGTGVVHTAVMYGEDDYNLGTKVGLPKFHTVDEQGKFTNAVPELAGLYVKDKQTEDTIIEKLKDNGNLLKEEDYEHDYPFCWRCDTPLIYYAKESWFIKMSALRDKLLKNNGKVNWFPEHIKEGRFGQWLKEGKDWAFSRERYWGTPLPVWRCQTRKLETLNPKSETNSKFQIQNSKHENGCGEYLVPGSLEELDKYRYRKPNTYWLMRHGESESNVNRIIDPGNHNFKLTEQGRKQAKISAENLKNLFAKKKEKLDAIIASPVARTQETASIASEILGVRVITEDRLKEIQLGPALAGCHDSKYHEEYPTYKSKFEQRPIDGESLTDLHTRQWELIKELEEKHEGMNILVIGHEYPIWMFADVANGWTMEESIAEKEKRGTDFVTFAQLEPVVVRNLPRDEKGYVDLHRPYIDNIELKCKKCGGKMSKVPDLIDVWFDSGAMPYAQWHWPFENEKQFKEQFPADFIVEAIDQTRGWFYTLLAVSTLLDKGAPYKNVMVLGHTLDEKGRKMSKKLKNFVPVMELMDKYGADVLRWYFLSSMPMGESKSVIPKEIEDKFKGFMTTLDNCVRFYELYEESCKPQAVSDKQNEKTYSLKPKTYNLLDKWILSKLHGLVSEVTESLDNYDPTTAARAIEKFVIEDFSNWWLRRSRKRKEALGLLRFVLLELAKVIAPFTPFVAEDIHKRLHKGHSTGTESVHLHDWPKVDKKLIDNKLEQEMKKVREVVTAGLALRKEKHIKVRQPLAKLVLRQELGIMNRELGELTDLIKEELNVKEVVFNDSQKEGVVLDTELTPPLIYEGYAREAMRQIQDMRKEAKYRLDDRVFGQWHSDDKDMSEAIQRWSDEIKKEVLLSEFRNGLDDNKTYDIEKEFEIVPQRNIWIGIKK